MPSPLQGFDQVVAITQNHINAGLDTRFQLVPELQRLDAAGEWGKISADMSPATVYLSTPHEPFKVRFCVNLSLGTCEWYGIDTSTRPPSIKTYTSDVNNWTLAFIVNLSLQAIDNIPDDIKEKIIFPGSYSLSQLLLDFTTADLSSFDPDLTNTPGIDLTDPDCAVAFEHFMETYLKELSNNGSNIFGYAVTVPDPAVANPYAPSFPPVSVQFQTMEHQNASGSPDAPELDCFLFLEMTSKDRTAPSLITWTKNWVEQGKSGAMVISKANFWDRFFVLRSTFLNLMALTMLNRLAHVFDNSEDKDKWDIPWGITDQEPTDLEWKSATELSISYDWGHDEAEHTINTYDKYARTCNTKVDVSLDTGNNAITVTASSHVWRKYVQITPAGREWIKETHTVDATINWGYSFTFDSVTDGTLAMSAKLVSPNCSVTLHNDSSIGKFWGPSDQDLSTWATEDLQSRVDSNNTLLTDVTAALKTHSQFIFPGGGYFFMKDPQYNSDGDLIVSLQYKQE